MIMNRIASPCSVLFGGEGLGQIALPQHPPLMRRIGTAGIDISYQIFQAMYFIDFKWFTLKRFRTLAATRCSAH
jgi:hypothetical protein